MCLEENARISLVGISLQSLLNTLKFLMPERTSQSCMRWKILFLRNLRAFQYQITVISHIRIYFCKQRKGKRAHKCGIGKKNETRNSVREREYKKESSPGVEGKKIRFTMIGTRCGESRRRDAAPKRDRFYRVGIMFTTRNASATPCRQTGYLVLGISGIYESGDKLPGTVRLLF